MINKAIISIIYVIIQNNQLWFTHVVPRLAKRNSISVFSSSQSRPIKHQSKSKAN